mmetsp:Transcript_14422/g.23868  ORF Transcript_14422/g.23868 Transcript_14422/m.23868 type:complete len:91 (-) Transcript_14422:5-277(-)
MHTGDRAPEIRLASKPWPIVCCYHSCPYPVRIIRPASRIGSPTGTNSSVGEQGRGEERRGESRLFIKLCVYSAMAPFALAVKPERRGGPR